MPTSNTDELHYDPEAAENAWTATADLRSAVGASTLPALDLADASVLGLRVSRDILKPEVRGKFEKLPQDLFDHDLLDRIEPASWALWYGATRMLSLGAIVDGGKVRVKTLDAAKAVRDRMLLVADYMLSTDPDAGREIADIKSGHGYADLAGDLTRLAALYQKYESVVSKGGAHYDAADVDAAKASAGQILYELGDSEEKQYREMKGETARAFVVLQDAYDTVRRWAAAIWADPDYIPSLYSVRTRSARRSTGSSGDGGGNAGGGAGQGGGGGNAGGGAGQGGAGT